MNNFSDDELLDALGVDITPTKAGSFTAKEERIIAGFEDILRFTEVKGRIPQYGEDQDIFERLYATRLERIRAMPETHHLLKDLDDQGLLSQPAFNAQSETALVDDESLLTELGVDLAVDDITVLKHVNSFAERQAAEEMAQRTTCQDFDQFKPLFEQIERDLQSDTRQTRRFGKETSINAGDFFILGGQLVYVAEIGETIKAPNGESDARLRAIYSNSTESNLLRRSLQRALYKDESGRRITDPDAGPLFRETLEENDLESGTIYVLRSLSSHPFVAEHRELIHKIGVTGGKVETRIANAIHDATYLLAEVEIVATYKLANINRTKLESLFHRIFAKAQLDLIITDRFGNPVKPKEWFLLPLHVIDQAVKHIVDGTITDMVYDLSNAELIY